MGLKYDFDIVTIAPDDTYEGNEGTDIAKENVPAKTAEGVPTALFRDVKTADALRAASPNIRQIFLDAGFRLNTSDSGVPCGFFPADDAPERIRILRRLFANIRKTQLRGEYCGEFDFAELFRNIKETRPLTAALPDLATPQQLPEKAQPERPTVVWRIGFALGLAVVLFVLIKFLVSAGIL